LCVAPPLSVVVEATTINEATRSKISYVLCRASTPDTVVVVITIVHRFTDATTIKNARYTIAATWFSILKRDFRDVVRYGFYIGPFAYGYEIQQMKNGSLSLLVKCDYINYL